MRERGLELSAEKTVITHIEHGFDFLGQTVRTYRTGKRTRLLITPSKKSVKAFLRKIRTRIKASRHLTAGELITVLNPMIRGWALYHRHVRSQSHLPRRRPRHLPGHLEMGTSQTSTQRAPMGASQILS
jgi:RNA-directed DNA polymerase